MESTLRESLMRECSTNSECSPRRRKKMKKATLFDKSIIQNIKYSEAIFASMMDLGEVTLLPELYHCFGYERMMKFLDIFAGTTFVVPSKVKLENAIRDAMIFTKLSKRGRKGKTQKAALKSVCKEYRMTKKTAIGIYNRILAQKRKYQGLK